jgi:hypothetical protein
MHILHVQRKVRFLNILELVRIYKNTKLKFRLNDIYGDVYSAIFDAFLSYELGRRNYTTKLQFDCSTSRNNTAQISALQDNTTNAV